MNLVFSYPADEPIRQAFTEAFARRMPHQDVTHFILQESEPLSHFNYRLRQLDLVIESVIYVLNRMSVEDMKRFGITRNLASRLSVPMMIVSPFSVLEKNAESEQFRLIVGSVEELIYRHYCFSQMPTKEASLLAACQDLISKFDSGWYGRFQWQADQSAFVSCGRRFTSYA